MQAVHNDQSLETHAGQPVLRISLEGSAYLVLVLFVLLLRVAELDTVPMSDAEALQALPAYHALHPDAPGEPQPAQSALTFYLQIASFTLLGGTELAARLPGVMAAVVLVLMPLLFRERIGRDRSFVLSVLLGVSPIAFAASRFADPALWTVIFALALGWAAWRYWESRSRVDALLLAFFAAVLAFLTEPGGVWLLLAMLGAAFVALWWTVLLAPVRMDSPGDDLLLEVRASLREYPWGAAGLTAAGVLLLMGTGFMLYPAGLSIVGETLLQALAGFIQPSQEGSPALFPLLTMIVYNPLLIVLGVTGAVFLILRQVDTFADRFLMSALALMALFFVVYAGGRPGWALFLVLPLAWLTTQLAREIVTTYPVPSFVNQPSPWVIGALAAAVVGVLLILSLHIQGVGRGLMIFPVGGDLTTLMEPQFNYLRASTIWIVISAVLLAVGYFLAMSLWGSVTALQGLGLGVLLFMVGAGVGTGWSVAVTNSSNPAELWHNSAISPDAPLLRETLLEISQRDTLGFPQIPLAILLDEAAGIHDDRFLAWLVRDFENARFVASLADARRGEIVLLPASVEEPDLGGSYVGQSFALRSYASVGDLGLLDWVPWLSLRQLRAQGIPRTTAILWLRIDVYDGIPADERP